MAYGRYRDDEDIPRNPITGIPVGAPGSIGNPTRYYDPNQPGGANDTAARAEYGKEVGLYSYRNGGGFSAGFEDLQRRSRANPENARFYGPAAGYNTEVGANPSIAKTVLAQVLPDLPQNPFAGATTPFSLAASNGTSQPARSLSEMASQGNHAEEWMRSPAEQIGLPTTSYGRKTGRHGTITDTPTGNTLTSPYGGGTTTFGEPPTRQARFDFRSGRRNSRNTGYDEYDDEIVRFQSRYGFGSGYS